MYKQRKLTTLTLIFCLLVSLLIGTSHATQALPFTDVAPTDWCHSSVSYVFEKGLMTGTGERTFSPDATTTRGMIVTILHRMQGTPIATGETFSDVADHAYYAEGIRWASANGIVEGYGDGRFGPNDPITREQMAAILYRYTKHLGTGSVITDRISGFSDGRQVSSYAREAMNWAIGTGLITGIRDQILDPTGGATRAQVATILMRFCTQNGTTTSNSLLQNFSADETFFLAGDLGTTTFTVRAVTNTKTISLYNDKGLVGTMNDSGINGDLIAGDRIYSYRQTYTSSTAGTVKYWAEADSTQSNPLSVYYFSRPTEATLAATRSAVSNIRLNIENIENRYTDPYGNIPKTQLATVIRELETYAANLQAQGQLIWYESNDTSILFKLDSGFTFVHTPNLYGYDATGSNLSLQIASYQPSLRGYGNYSENYISYPVGITNALTMPDNAASNVASTFDTCSFSNATNYDDEQVTLAQIKALSSNQVVLWHGHGGYSDTYHSFLVTGEDFDWNAYKNNRDYQLDNIQGRILQCTSGKVAFTPNFISKYCGTMNHSLIYLATCESGQDSAMAEAFLRKGAAAVVANSDTILTLYNLTMQYTIMDYMTQTNPSTNSCYTLGEALVLAKNAYGQNDARYGGSGAHPIIFGGINAETYSFGQVSTQSPSQNPAWAPKNITLPLMHAANYNTFMHYSYAEYDSEGRIFQDLDGLSYNTGSSGLTKYIYDSQGRLVEKLYCSHVFHEPMWMEESHVTYSYPSENEIVVHTADSKTSGSVFLQFSGTTMTMTSSPTIPVSDILIESILPDGIKTVQWKKIGTNYYGKDVSVTDIYRYDASGRLIEKQTEDENDGSCSITTFEYDDFGYLVKHTFRNYPANSTSNNGNGFADINGYKEPDSYWVFEYEYNEAGQMTSCVFRDQISGTECPFGFTYHSNGNLKSLLILGNTNGYNTIEVPYADDGHLSTAFPIFSNTLGS